MHAIAKLMVVLGAIACSQSAGGTPTGPSAANSELYDRLGGLRGLSVIVDEWVSVSASDVRLEGLFFDLDVTAAKSRILHRLCVVVGGPCVAEETDSEQTIGPQPFGDRELTGRHRSALLGNLALALAARVTDEDTRREIERLAPLVISDATQVVRDAPEPP